MKKNFKCLPGLFLTGLLVMLSAYSAFAQAPDSSAKIVPVVAQRLSFVTIGVKDLTKLKQFYIEKFGWTPIKSGAGIAFFKMNGFILGLYPSDDMAAGAGVAQDGTGFKRFSCTIYYPSEKEVDVVFATLRDKGVNIIKQPKKASWGGYIGYVADPEGNIWEIGYNPAVELNSKGDVVTHH